MRISDWMSDVCSSDLLNVRVARAEQSISAVLAEPGVAEQLGVAVGSALLSLHRVVRDESGRPVEWLYAQYRPDRYEYRMNMQAHDMPGQQNGIASCRERVCQYV